MRFAYRLHGFGTTAPSPLRRYARAYAYRGLPALAFALPGRQRLNANGCLRHLDLLAKPPHPSPRLAIAAVRLEFRRLAPQLERKQAAL